MLAEPVSLSIAALAPRIDACELCATPGEPLRAAVTVRRTRGSAVSLAACDRCAAAMRRVLAVAGGGPATVSDAWIEATDQPGVVSPSDTVSDLVGSAVLVHEFAEPFVGHDGLTCTARAWGQARADGMWIGWLTFVARGGTIIRKTPRETSQSTREHLAYWASGLQPSYLEGAYQRAT